MARAVPVFYTAAQVAEKFSYSPSAGKPADVVASWRARGYPIRLVAPVPVTIDDLALAHDRRFVEDVLALRVDNGFGNRSAAVARSLCHTSGAMLASAREALSTRSIACAPCSGFHHAGYDHAAGFCTFNGLMVTTLKLKAEGLVRRVGILDCDQHYGDGTDNIIDRERAAGWVRHISAGRHYKREALPFLDGLPALVQGFADCDLLLYQAGADPHVDDPLGGYLDDDQLARRDAIVFAEAHRLRIPVAWNLAGGYQEPLRKVLDIHDRTMAACVRQYVDEKGLNKEPR